MEAIVDAMIVLSTQKMLRWLLDNDYISSQRWRFRGATGCASIDVLYHASGVSRSGCCCGFATLKASDEEVC